MTTIKITQDDIARGKPGDTHSCPVVLAATGAVASCQKSRGESQRFTGVSLSSSMMIANDIL